MLCSWRMLAILSVSGFTAIAVRKAVKTEMIDPEPMEKPPPLLSKQGYDAALGIVEILTIQICLVEGLGSMDELPF